MKASVFIGVSVDGFIARANGDLDWLPTPAGDEHGYNDFIASIDCLVIGRKTYETVLGFGDWAYGSKPVFVLSSRELAPAPKKAVVERMYGEPAAILAELSGRGFQHAYVDGGQTIQGFLRAGQIQRLVITRVPVLIGTGIPLFGETGHDIRLEHVATRSFKSGLVQSEYEVL